MRASRCLEMKVWLTIVISWLCFGPGYPDSVSDQVSVFISITPIMF